MRTKRKPHQIEAGDSAEDRLAAYAVTRVLCGKTRTGLPVREIRRTLPGSVEAAEPVAPDLTVVQLRPVEERRAEERRDVRLAVCASYPGSDDTIEGVTADVSRSGLHLRMSEPPGDAHQDVLVKDDEGTSVLWVQVLKFRFVPEHDSYSWHARVIAADDDWAEILARLGLSLALSNVG